MKKTLIAAAAAVALTASAAAEITFGAWLRTLPVFAASNGDETIAGLTNSWGWGARTARIDVNAVAEDGNAGFYMGVYEDAKNGVGAADGTYMWVKPVEQVKLTVGQLDNNTGLRGDFCYGSWNWIRPCNWIAEGEGFTFSKVNQLGALVEVFPTEGLNVFAAVPLDATKLQTKAEDQYKKIQAGFGYGIDGVGTLKAQYIGAGDDSAIEAAFDLTSVENLFATVGFKYNNWDNAVATSETIRLTAGVSYQVTEEAKVYADFQFQAYDDIDADMAFGAGVDYNIGDGLALNADVRGAMVAKDHSGTGDAETYLSFLVGLTKGISSNGLIGVGFQGSTNGKGFLSSWHNDTTEFGLTPAEADSFCWAIPVRVEMWF
ncbi:MAG: hypothetical protein K6B17_05145 [Treponema sp.]|nr:hypothetical protein [Treponema sp.]